MKPRLLEHRRREAAEARQPRPGPEGLLRLHPAAAERLRQLLRRALGEPQRLHLLQRHARDAAHPHPHSHTHTHRHPRRHPRPHPGRHPEPALLRSEPETPEEPPGPEGGAQGVQPRGLRPRQGGRAQGARGAAELRREHPAGLGQARLRGAQEPGCAGKAAPVRLHRRRRRVHLRLHGRGVVPAPVVAAAPASTAAPAPLPVSLPVPVPAVIPIPRPLPLPLPLTFTLAFAVAVPLAVSLPLPVPVAAPFRLAPVGRGLRPARAGHRRRRRLAQPRNLPVDLLQRLRDDVARMQLVRGSQCGPSGEDATEGFGGLTCGLKRLLHVSLR